MNDDESYECNDCGHPTYPGDPYYATPCGTYCSRCMRQHVKQCGVCKNEFYELDEENENNPDTKTTAEAPEI